VSRDGFKRKPERNGDLQESSLVAVMCFWNRRLTYNMWDYKLKAEPIPTPPVYTNRFNLLFELLPQSYQTNQARPEEPNSAGYRDRRDIFDVEVIKHRVFIKNAHFHRNFVISYCYLVCANEITVIVAFVIDEVYAFNGNILAIVRLILPACRDCDVVYCVRQIKFEHIRSSPIVIYNALLKHIRSTDAQVFVLLRVIIYIASPPVPPARIVRYPTDFQILMTARPHLPNQRSSNSLRFSALLLPIHFFLLASCPRLYYDKSEKSREYFTIGGKKWGYIFLAILSRQLQKM